MENLFAYNLKNYRKKNNLTLTELSEKLGISRTALSGYEKGLNEPSLYVLFKIANIMNCSLDELVGISTPTHKIEKVNPPKPENIDDLKEKILILNNLIDKNRRTFEDLTKSIKRSSYLIDELTMSKKRSDRMIDELTMSKKRSDKMLEELSTAKRRNDLTFEELKRTINRLSKTEELFKNVSSDLLSLIDNKSNTEHDNEISCTLVDINEKIKSNNISTRSIPLIGSVAAGNPCYAEESVSEYFDVDASKLNSYKNYFILNIKGDSMNKLYDDKELILIEQTNSADNDDLVIAFLPDNVESTFKRVKIVPGSDLISLIPESFNPTHKVQTYNYEDISIIGKVLGPLSDFSAE